MAWFNSARLKKVWLRRAARIQRSATRTADSTLDLSLGLTDPGGDHHGAVVLREIQVSGVDIGFVAARVGYADL